MCDRECCNVHVTHFARWLTLYWGGNMCPKLDLTLRSKDAHTHTCYSGCFLMWQTHVGCTIMMVTFSRWPQVNRTIMIVPSSNDLMSVIYLWWPLLKTISNWLQHDDGTFSRLFQIDGFFKLVTPSRWTFAKMTTVKRITPSIEPATFLLPHNNGAPSNLEDLPKLI